VEILGEPKEHKTGRGGLDFPRVFDAAFAKLLWPFVESDDCCHVVSGETRRYSCWSTNSSQDFIAVSRLIFCVTVHPASNYAAGCGGGRSRRARLEMRKLEATSTDVTFAFLCCRNFMQILHAAASLVGIG